MGRLDFEVDCTGISAIKVTLSDTRRMKKTVNRMRVSWSDVG